MELNKEILKGHIDTMILAILEKNDSYGFEIAKNVLEQTTFELKDGTLYISLKRLGIAYLCHTRRTWARRTCTKMGVYAGSSCYPHEKN